MRRLILFRHGKAATAGPSGGDKERPLVERGEVDSANTGDWLRGAGYAPDLVLMSPSARTRATWESARPFFPRARAEAREALYLADVDTIWDVVADAAAEADTVMVVGHNPGLQELCVRLAAEGDGPKPQIEHLEHGFPTAGACVFRTRDHRPPTLEAIYGPPRRPGEAPRWLFVGEPRGARD